MAVGQSPCIYGKGHHGNDREISVVLLGSWERAARVHCQVPMVNSGGWLESVLDKETYGKYHEWP